MIHEYKTGRSICGFVEFIAWVGVVLSGIAFLIAVGAATKGGEGVFALIALAPAVSAFLTCLMVILIVHIARAAMDSSVAAQKNVIQSKQQHEELLIALRVPRQSLQSSIGDKLQSSPDTGKSEVAGDGPRDSVSASNAGVVTGTASETHTPTQISYRGHQIVQDGDAFFVGSARFDNLGLARNHVGELVDQAANLDRSR